jgi:hypothetical protein
VLQVYEELKHPAYVPNVTGKAATTATAGAKHGTEELLEVCKCTCLLVSEFTPQDEPELCASHRHLEVQLSNTCLRGRFQSSQGLSVL